MRKKIIVTLLMGSLVPLMTWGQDLFKDTFNRPGSSSVNENLPMGQRGDLIPTPWDEHTETVGQPNAKIASNQLLLSNKGEMGALSLRHNFIDSSIYDNGGFRVRFEITEFKTKALFTDLAEDYYCGFGVGLEGRDLARWSPYLQSFSIRGTGYQMGTSCFWVGLGNPRHPEVQIRSHGTILESIPVDKLTGVLDVTFHLGGFDQGEEVTVYVRYNDRTIDLDSSSEKSSRTFKWKANNSNNMAIEARASDYVQIDDFSVSNISKRYNIKRAVKKQVIVTRKQTAVGIFGCGMIFLLLFRRVNPDE